LCLKKGGIKLCLFLNRINNDIKTIYRNDPAANNVFEILFAYPGFHARQFQPVSAPALQMEMAIFPTFYFPTSAVFNRH